MLAGKTDGIYGSISSITLNLLFDANMCRDDWFDSVDEQQRLVDLAKALA